MLDRKDFAARLVRWQRVHGRNDLPWQGTRDPYRVWLSEIMLQQTQVATVRAYYARFTERFPDVGALAAAHEDEVMGLWSGLGYYTRARNLHRCAQMVVSAHGGAFPRDAATLASLPGIGRSTAAAIASVCFGECVPILDANVKRVISRVFAFDGDLAQAAQERRLWSLAAQLLPQGAGAARDMPRYTQGMMDLGATLCSPRKPNCPQCPVQGLCAGSAQDPTAFPVRTRKLRRSSEALWLLCLQREDGAVWLSQRAAKGIWARLYCLPLWAGSVQLEEAVQSMDCQTVQRVDLPPFIHVLTHKDLHLHPVRLRVPQTMGVALEGGWYLPDQWEALGLPAPVRKLLERLR